MRILSDYSRTKKLRHFLPYIPENAELLEVGCGDSWVRDDLAKLRNVHYTGIDLHPPADIVGSIKDWRSLGLQPGSFDVIVAFEVVEHVDCFQECYDLLKDGGKMLITTPNPPADFILYTLERFGLNQERTSPHDHLVHLRSVPEFEVKDVRLIACLSQWAVFTKATQKQENTPQQVQQASSQT